MRPATTQDLCLLFEVLNKHFWVMDSNGTWRRSSSRSVWSPVVEQLDLEKEIANPHDEPAVAVIGASQIVGHIKN